MESFINAISTNLTKFFREAHHFEHLRTHVATAFAQTAGRKPAARLRIWSAGCSTGEEPYTIAAVLKREIPDVRRYDVRILATDIDTEVIARGARGEYPPSSLDDVPRAYREFFQQGSSGKSATIVMGEEFRSLIVFRRLNLMEAWPFSGKFDAIFCRNVMIYFDGPTKSALVDRFAQQLQSGRLAVYRPFGIADRIASVASTLSAARLIDGLMTDAAALAHSGGPLVARNSGRSPAGASSTLQAPLG